jgi:4a-hydroxytetrahydrobiopterin dehydratase
LRFIFFKNPCCYWLKPQTFVPLGAQMFYKFRYFMKQNQIEIELKKLNNWVLKNGAIFKEFKFKNFAESLNFVNQIGKIAEEQNHHPDIEFGWRYCKIYVQSHDVEGLSEKDFKLATTIDQLTINH